MHEEARKQPAGGCGCPTLEALRFGWGSAYEFGGDADEFWAVRRDGLGGKITADSPDSLRDQVFADYSLKPVPREFAPPETLL